MKINKLNYKMLHNEKLVNDFMMLKRNVWLFKNRVWKYINKIFMRSVLTMFKLRKRYEKLELELIYELSSSKLSETK